MLRNPLIDACGASSFPSDRGLTLMDLAQWAAANALGKPESEWLMNGRDVE
jgi:hypothetical protein